MYGITPSTATVAPSRKAYGKPTIRRPSQVMPPVIRDAETWPAEVARQQIVVVGGKRADPRPDRAGQEVADMGDDPVVVRRRR